MESFRVGEKITDFDEFFDRLISSSYVGEGDGGLVLGHLSGLGLAERHDTASSALHRAEEEPEDADEQRVAAGTVAEQLRPRGCSTWRSDVELDMRARPRAARRTDLVGGLGSGSSSHEAARRSPPACPRTSWDRSRIVALGDRALGDLSPPAPRMLSSVAAGSLARTDCTTNSCSIATAPPTSKNRGPR